MMTSLFFLSDIRDGLFSKAIMANLIIISWRRYILFRIATNIHLNLQILIYKRNADVLEAGKV
jgi:hypothetical protein